MKQGSCPRWWFLLCLSPTTILYGAEASLGRCDYNSRASLSVISPSLSTPLLSLGKISLGSAQDPSNRSLSSEICNSSLSKCVVPERSLFSMSAHCQRHIRHLSSHCQLFHNSFTKSQLSQKKSSQLPPSWLTVVLGCSVVGHTGNCSSKFPLVINNHYGWIMSHC